MVFAFSNGLGKSGSFIIPDGVTSIGECAFCHCVLDHIKIPTGVTSIGDDAFWCCDVESITLPKSVESIGKTYMSWYLCSVMNVYYEGTAADRDKISIDRYDNLGNYYGLINSHWYYYSEDKPTTEGDYWHYVNGIPTKW